MDRKQLRKVAYYVGEEFPVCRISASLEVPFMEVLEAIQKKGLRSPPHPGPPPKLPRGKGFTKAAMTAASNSLRSYDGTLAEWARAEGIIPDLLFTALKGYELMPPGAHPLPDELSECPYCTRTFLPTNTQQTYCTTKCSADARRDADYFGGNRRNTIGLLAGICQCCGVKPKKGISSHHVFGKEEDPDNEFLIAVCSGCHDIVTRLSRRRYGMVAGSWGALVTLSTVRAGTGSKVEVRMEGKLA